MRALLIGFSALFLFSCGPSEGDVYEHKTTESRYFVDKVGVCTDIYDEYRKEDDDRLVWFPSEDEGNSNRCVGLTDGGSSITLEKVDYLKERYAKVYW